MKTTTTIKVTYPLLNFAAALAVMRAAIKTRLVRMLAEKPMSSGEVAQALELSSKREYYWHQITIGSSRL